MLPPQQCCTLFISFW